MSGCQQQRQDVYYRLAIASTVLSALCTLGVLLAVPLLLSRANFERSAIEVRADRFRQDVDRIWAQLHQTSAPGVPAGPASTQGQPPDVESNKNTPQKSDSTSKPEPIYFSLLRQRRSPWERQVCQGCSQLNCPAGSPGNPGPPGDDGNPGDAGRPGRAGEDGMDVELAPEDDLPCVICPGGPPGMR